MEDPSLFSWLLSEEPSLHNIRQLGSSPSLPHCCSAAADPTSDLPELPPSVVGPFVCALPVEYDDLPLFTNATDPFGDLGSFFLDSISWEDGIPSGHGGARETAPPPATDENNILGGGGARREPSTATGMRCSRAQHKARSIGFEEVSRHFCMPITAAARAMNVGLTVLKKRCRELGISRWPHRKMKSLNSLIRNVQELGKGVVAEEKIRGEVETLEEERKAMERSPETELTERAKKLRQTCFKANFKRRRAAMSPHLFALLFPPPP